ncbi:MAG: zinc ribbon domain-containing protein [Chloroflexi bacterium]|jgi:putative FmdB family regulatory protein|nr:zinc ribbon domain-containing protein [Chloroflexota bacterium]
MPTYDYKCKECGKVFEVFRRFSDYDKEIRCPSCGSDKAERIFSVPQISGETVAGSGYGKTESPQVSPGLGRGMGRGLGRGPRDGRGMGRGRGRTS